MVMALGTVPDFPIFYGVLRGSKCEVFSRREGHREADSMLRSGRPW